MFKLFVYGTLKRGYPLHRHYLSRSKFLKEDKVKGQLYTYNDGGIPFLNAKAKGSVEGEIFEVSREAIMDVATMEMNAGYDFERTTTEGGEVVYYFPFKANFHKRYFTKINKF